MVSPVGALEKVLGSGELTDIKLSVDDALKLLAHAKSLGNNAIERGL